MIIEVSIHVLSITTPALIIFVHLLFHTESFLGIEFYFRTFHTFQNC